MPRGLGALQREILDTLDEAAAFAMTRDGRYRGNDYWCQLPEGHRLRQRGAVVAAGTQVRIAADVYDLRASIVYLARRHRKMDRARRVKMSFSASFSSAIRSPRQTWRATGA
jgi:hypothetical protein